MVRRLCLALTLGWAWAVPAPAETAPGIVERCLSCHLTETGDIDIVGLRALRDLPEEWLFLFEDEIDRDGDGIAGRIRFVSGSGMPLVARFGSALAAARFEDFARIAGAAHGIPLDDPAVLAKVEADFLALSPDPVSPFANEAERLAFEAHGCAACHVTRSYSHDGRDVMPFSDFLLHDLAAGPRRTTPLWGCPACVDPATDPHDGGASLTDGSRTAVRRDDPLRPVAAVPFRPARRPPAPVPRRTGPY